MSFPVEAQIKEVNCQQKIPVVSPAEKPPGFLRRENDQTNVTRFAEPAAQLVQRVMMLIRCSLPVEGVANAVFPACVTAD